MLYYWFPLWEFIYLVYSKQDIKGQPSPSLFVVQVSTRSTSRSHGVLISIPGDEVRTAAEIDCSEDKTNDNDNDFEEVDTDNNDNGECDHNYVDVDADVWRWSW